MTDPLAGMTREEARALVEQAKDYLPADWRKVLALAALGAECVGAERVVWKDITGMPPGTYAVLVLKEDR